MTRPSVGLYFILPAILVLFMLIAYPIVYTLYLSAIDAHGNFTGKNYSNVLRLPATRQSFFNLIYYVGGSIVFQVILGTLTAILLNLKFWGRSAVRSIALIPWVVPGIVAATTWAWMFHTEFGIINYMLTGAHVIPGPIGWLTDRNTVMPVLIAINVWKLFPFVAIMVLAGLQAIPADLYEAAKVDGASFWEEVWYVTLPQVRPVLVAVTLLLVIWGLNAITLIYAITQGGPAGLSLITPIQIYQLAFVSFQFNEAAALSVLFFIVAAIIVAIYIKVIPSNVEPAK
ncbi:MAG TPA: sugar ABC transporter permease [Devosiaceae bacterium]|jgi:multiple sugar transport system permease protein|nr:sugar ABC transporter permease [Devosiaceae bacterium]